MRAQDDHPTGARSPSRGVSQTAIPPQGIIEVRALSALSSTTPPNPVSSTGVWRDAYVQCAGESFRAEPKSEALASGARPRGRDTPRSDHFYATRNPGAGQEFTDLAAAVRLRLRVAIGLQALQRCSGLLNRRARGSTVATHHFQAGVAQQRQQQFRKLPGDSPHGSASLPVGPIYWPYASSSRSSNYQSGRLRTARLQARFLPGVPFRRVSPTTRDAPLRTERLGVEIPHAAPIWPT
jgi:hypothetical protein